MLQKRETIRIRVIKVIKIVTKEEITIRIADTTL